MVDYARQAILHALLAAGVVETLLHVWNVRPTRLRLAFRLLALALPLLALPAFFLLAPVRTSDWFADHRAVFATARWAGVQVGGAGVDQMVFSALALAGTALYLLDLVPFLAARLLHGPTSEPGPAAASALSGRVARVAAAMRMPPPPVRIVHDESPVLLCRGVRHPALVASAAVAERLDDRQLDAALAHELVHVRHRDPLLGWILMAARTLMFFNPFVQLMARAAVHEIERRADEEAAAVVDARAEVAAAIVALFRRSHADTADCVPAGAARLAAPQRLLQQARLADVERRCRRLLERDTSPVPPFGGLRLALTGVGLVALLFFVV